MKILLVCAAGISSEALIGAIQKVADSVGVKIELSACGVCDVEKQIQGYDIILLGPQIRYQVEKIRMISQGIPVQVIDKMDYAMQDGRNILKLALAAAKKR